MFPDRGRSCNALKHLTEKVTAVASLTRVRVVVNHTMPHPTAKINKIKDLALTLRSVSSPYQNFIICKKTS